MSSIVMAQLAIAIAAWCGPSSDKKSINHCRHEMIDCLSVTTFFNSNYRLTVDSVEKLPECMKQVKVR